MRWGSAAVDVEWQPRAPSTTAAPDTDAPDPPRDVAVPAAEPPDGALEHVRAPLVGTFYRAPSPGAAPFVEEGDCVEPGQQIGIIESMKLMNAICADRAGRVEQVLVADATPVEYDQRLVALGPHDPELPAQSGH
jgi:acetyl-CoA carboxylase biotin carboxyl carrier protein